MRAIHTLVMLAVAWVAGSGAVRADEVWVDSLDLGKVRQDWGKPQANKAVEGGPLSIGGRRFERGVGTHVGSEVSIDLQGNATRFVAVFGIDDEANGRLPSAGYEVLGDDRTLAQGEVTPSSPAASLDLDVSGVKYLTLIATPPDAGIDFGHVDWADARITYTGTPPQTTAMPHPAAMPPVILTPRPGPSPRLTGASVFGVRPGSPLLYTVSATGERPMRFQAEGLPTGAALDADTGRITGKVDRPGDYPVTITAANAHGQVSRVLRLSVGQSIALTPPMGWNSWNCFAGAVDDAKVRSAADAMVASGLADHGYSYINIDDCWQGQRDAAGVIQPNDRFPDMKALFDYIHARGLKAGIYSSPGPKTCAGFEGSYQREAEDAMQYARWGVDYLKYDWCSYGQVADGNGPEALMKPYRVMREALDKVDRDIVYSLCQYGMGNVSSWGARVGGNLWRTTGDITDTWQSMSSIGFGQRDLGKYAQPGQWNDPDMLVVGKVGWGNLHPTGLTPDEQYTHITLWSLLAAPLLIGCDMTQMDAFTVSLLTNDEVIEVNQDPLGRQASCIARRGMLEVWAKDMSDGSVAVGLFNRYWQARDVRVQWDQLQRPPFAGTLRVRDVWRQRDLGDFADGYQASVAPHGCLLLRVWPAK